MSIRLILIAVFIPLQSCSNSSIGEKLENSFDTTDRPSISKDTKKVKVQKKMSEIKRIKISTKDNNEETIKESDTENIIEENLISKKNRFVQKPTKSIKKAIFNPQPYRIILKLSGANPSAPAETVTSALRKAGVEFEVEKIERFAEENFLKDTSLKK